MGGSWDSAARRYWRNANIDRGLAQDAYETLGGTDDLSRFLPTVWEQFAALPAGGPPELPAGVTQAWEPNQLADPAVDPVLSSWANNVGGGGTLTTVGANDFTISDAIGAWTFLDDDGSPILRHVRAPAFPETGNLRNSVSGLTQAGGIMFVGALDPASTGSNRALFGTQGSDLFQEDGTVVSFTRTGGVNLDLDGTPVLGNPIVMHLQMGDAAWAVGGLCPNSLAAEIPRGGAAEGGYDDPADISCAPNNGWIHGLYVYEGGPSVAALLWNYIGARYIAVLGGG